ncbi:MAG: thioredoxin family protein [Cytophagales bacterium]|nr:MAG: thioredoxin family protein [Cytophagales bacterium]TAF60947.1 MAG: thioredoxin family protein [Cytophagales bacterium]
MAKTETLSIPLGFEAPHFVLPDAVSGQNKSLSELMGSKATVVVFMCNHCPYVTHIIAPMLQIARDFASLGVKFIAINSNDVVNYPQDSPENMKKWAEELNFPFPFLYDETQDVARLYQAACTPDFSVFDAQKKCVYRGQFDDSRPKGTIPATGKDLRYVLENILIERELPSYQIPSMGCNIKWKKA